MRASTTASPPVAVSATVKSPGSTLLRLASTIYHSSRGMVSTGAAEDASGGVLSAGWDVLDGTEPEIPGATSPSFPPKNTK